MQFPILPDHRTQALSTSTPHRLQTLLVNIARFSAGAWTGGAVLFVVTSVAEQTHPHFDSTIRDQLAAVRFPYYYLFCWICLGLQTATTAAATYLARQYKSPRMLLATSLATLSILIAIADHQLIYKPLLQLITPPGKTRTQQFERLHSASRYVNQLHVGLAAIAGILICLPTTYPNSRCD